MTLAKLFALFQDLFVPKNILSLPCHQTHRRILPGATRFQQGFRPHRTPWRGLCDMIRIISAGYVKAAQLCAAEPELNFFDIAPVFLDVVVTDIAV